MSEFKTQNPKRSEVSLGVSERGSIFHAWSSSQNDLMERQQGKTTMPSDESFPRVQLPINNGDVLDHPVPKRDRLWEHQPGFPSLQLPSE
jgi:hypothetical protein